MMPLDSGKVKGNWLLHSFMVQSTIVEFVRTLLCQFYPRLRGFPACRGCLYLGIACYPQLKRDQIPKGSGLRFCPSLSMSSQVILGCSHRGQCWVSSQWWAQDLQGLRRGGGHQIWFHCDLHQDIGLRSRRHSWRWGWEVPSPLENNNPWRFSILIVKSSHLTAGHHPGSLPHFAWL